MSEIRFVFLVADIPGVFAFDRDKNLIASSTFPREAETIEEKLKGLREGEVIEEVEDVIDFLDTENIVTDLPIELDGFTVEVKENVSASKHLKDNLRSLSKESGFVENDSQFSEIMRDIQILRTRREVKSSVKKDKVAAQAVSALQDLRRIGNELSERLQEWYGLYYPELEVEENEKYAELAAELDKREDFEGYEGSMGIDLDRRDIETIRSFARQVKAAYDQKEAIKEYLENVMDDIAPNVTHIIGAEMAAQLISLAGSLKKLARMPSSKIQLLGAEKALFRHLKGGGKPPKHGIIYNHPYIQKTPEGKRGKAARAIASKLMMAARTDQYTDKFKGEKYKEELEDELGEIRNE